jgi:hypothetical protein
MNKNNLPTKDGIFFVGKLASKLRAATTTTSQTLNFQRRYFYSITIVTCVYMYVKQIHVRNLMLEDYAKENVIRSTTVLFY